MLRITSFILACLTVFSINIKSNDESTMARPSDPASIIIVQKDGFDLNTPLSSNTTETYNPSSRKFQSMAKIQVVGNRVYAGWITGGTFEPDRDNYLVVSYSDDYGETWVDPYMIIDHPATLDVSIKNSMMFLDQFGTFWIGYFKEGRGMYAITSSNADSENIADVVWSKERSINDYGTENRPTILKSGEWLYTSRVTDDNTKTPVLSSVNYGKNFYVKSNAISSVPSEKKFAGESAIIEKENGTLVLFSRIESNGGIERYYSYDEGASWTKSETDLPAPLRSPGSRFVMMKLPSTHWLFITNNDLSERKNLTAYISLDEGETWSDGLLLDHRLGAEYPDASYDNDGNIYVVYDEGRIKEKEIRVCRFKEEDLLAGYFKSDNCINKGIINKINPNYVDIVSSSISKNNRFKINVNESTDEIINGLPTSITIYDANNNEYELQGTWNSSELDNTKAGHYYLYFETELPNDSLQDTFLQLTVEVFVVEKQEIKGCNGSINTCAVTLLFIILVLFIYKEKENA